MKEIKSGMIVAFMRENVSKKGRVEKVYEDLETVLVQVPEDECIYKTHISNLEVWSESNDQVVKKDMGYSITITPEEFKEITVKVIAKTLEDNAVVKMLSLFCELLQRELFKGEENA